MRFNGVSGVLGIDTHLAEHQQLGGDAAAAEAVGEVEHHALEAALLEVVGLQQHRQRLVDRPEHRRALAPTAVLGAGAAEELVLPQVALGQAHPGLGRGQEHLLAEHPQRLGDRLVGGEAQHVVPHQPAPVRHADVGAEPRRDHAGGQAAFHQSLEGLGVDEGQGPFRRQGRGHGIGGDLPGVAHRLRPTRTALHHDPLHRPGVVEGAGVLVLHQRLGLLQDPQLDGAAAQAVVVDPVAVEQLVAAEVADREQVVDPHPVVVVLGAELGVVLGDDATDPAAVEEARPDEVVLLPVELLGGARQVDLRRGRLAPVVGAELGVGQQLAPVVDRVVVGVDHGATGMLPQERDQPLELGRLHQVVGRRPGVELAGGELEGVGQRVGQGLVGLGQHPHLGVVVVAGEHRLDLVLGAVVEHDQLEVLVGLGQDAVDRVGQQVGLVVDRQHHADQTGSIDGPGDLGRAALGAQAVGGGELPAAGADRLQRRAGPLAQGAQSPPGQPEEPFAPAVSG